MTHSTSTFIGERHNTHCHDIILHSNSPIRFPCLSAFFFVCVSAGWRYSIFIAHNTHAHSFSRRWSASNFPASNAIFQFSLCVLCACTMHLPKNALRVSPHSSNSLSSLAVNRAIGPALQTESACIKLFIESYYIFLLSLINFRRPGAASFPI